MIEIPTVFFSHGHQLVGIRHHPDVATEKAVVLCHGYTGNKVENKRLFVETARALAGSGFMAFRFDFYGSGDSEGDFVDTRLETNIANLIDAVDLVRKMGYRRLGLLGLSVGAATCALAGGEVRADAIVLWSTVPRFRELFESRSNQELDPASLPEVFEYEGWQIHRDFLLGAMQKDVFEAVRKIEAPKLFVQGTDDGPLFVQGFHEFERLRLPQADFALIDGAGHTFQRVAHRKQVIDLTVKWLRRHL